MTFWIISGALALFIVLTLARAAARGAGGETEAAAYDLQIYRDQLNEVDRDLARGVIGEDEAERVRLEVSRRILAADAQVATPEARPTQPAQSYMLIGFIALASVLGSSFWLYDRLGAPGYQDRPLQARIAASEEMRQNRLTQAEAEARLPEGSVRGEEVTEEYLELMERLREAVADRPDDLQGLSLLARNEAALGNMRAAIEAQERLIALRGDEADAADHSFLVELMIGATGGYVSEEAEQSIRAALERDPQYPFARYYLAQYMIQIDRPDAAFRTLRALMEEGPPDAPWVAPIRQQIEELAWRAGVNYELPPQVDIGPSAADIAASQDMSPEERTRMIMGMVEGLSERLTTEGGLPEEWAQLIRALGVLDEKSRANDVWAEAREIFAEDPSALRRLYSAAQDADIAQ